MKRKSQSMKQLSSLPPIKGLKMPPALNYHSRLVFPIMGDTSFYRNYGRKHYQNNSDRLIKIILPQKYSLEKNAMRRQRSNSLPKLNPQFYEKLDTISEFPLSKSTVLPKQKSFKYLKNKNIIQNELNISNEFLQKQKNISVSAPTPEKRVSFQDNEQIILKKLSLNSSAFETRVVPKQFTEVTSRQQTFTKLQKKSTLLYNPQNKQIYDKLAAVRSKNPTHLSTGLSII